MHGSGEPPAALSIRCGDAAYTVQPADAPVLIGREMPAQIRINDPRISRIHARVDVRGGRWAVSDAGSTNGIYVDGRREQSLDVGAAAVVYLGHADGIPVAFAVDRAAAAPATTEIAIDAGIARAGAAVVERREELGYPPQRLEVDGVLSREVLAAFESGHAWPADDERARLETYLGWPPGAVAAVRAGSPAPEDESTEILSDTVQVEVMVDAVELALGGVRARIDQAPPRTDPAYPGYLDTLLGDLRRLEATVLNAGRATRRTDLTRLLDDIRRTHDDLNAARA